MKEKVLVSLNDFSEIVFVEGLLPGRILLLQTFFQSIRAGLQIDDQVGRGKLFAEIIVVAIISIEFHVIQVEAGKELVFLENKVADHHFLRLRTQIERPKLLEAADQKRELCLEPGSGFAFVKRAKKWVVFGFHHPLRIQTLRQDARQGAFTDSDRTFHCNVTG